MKTSDPISLSRLIDIRHEELEPLKADLLQLRHLCNELESRWKMQQQTHFSFLDDVREAEQGKLSAEQMLEWRRYLIHLANVAADAHDTFSDACKQRDQAQKLLSEKYSEILAMERLFDRRVESMRHESQRVEYLMQDDVEILRHMRNGADGAAR